ncbi:peptidase inhibitor family I36 protein [Streptomyces sp. NPDC049837]|uniref:peptidase inhibitor family I36 protein n=1 Tax=Streptomyces sp. NPDC049837 TaxID=3155277 RepID=UPI00342A91C2
MRSTTVLTTATTTAVLGVGALAAAVLGGAVPVAAAPLAAVPVAAAPPPRLGPCDTGQLCLWAKEGFRGTRHTHELTGVDIEACVPLPAGTTAAALANRTGRPVTTYQSAECAETGEFETYPGGGTWVPQSPYQVRAFKVWES